MKNIFIDMKDCDWSDPTLLRTRLVVLAESNNITQTKCNAMYCDYRRMIKCQDRIVKYTSKVW